MDDLRKLAHAALEELEYVEAQCPHLHGWGKRMLVIKQLREVLGTRGAAVPLVIENTALFLTAREPRRQT